MRLPRELHLFLLLILGLVSGSGAVAGTPTGLEFLGGSMSFEAFDDQQNNTLVNAKILTGWRLGKGQCGVACDHTSIGTDITAKYQATLAAKGSPTYFGEWQVEEKFAGQLAVPRPVTAEANNNITIQVMAVNDILGWELNKAEVTIKINEAAEYTDFIYEGHSWTPLSKQPTIKQWHMQLKINAKQRSDTNRPNRSPIVHITPYMTLGINRNYTLSIPIIDQDGDYFECRKMAFIEFMDLQTSYHLKNIEVRKDCFIQIDTSSPEYQVGDSAVIAVTIRDFNRENIKLAGDPHALHQRYTLGRSLSAVPLQFYIEIVLKDEAPVIIDPTPPEQQIFTVFVGSILQIKVVAKPTNPTRTLSHFFFTRRDGVVPQSSGVADETVIDPLAKSRSVLWTPVASDMGDHILCVRVEDSAGFDALPRCFIIRVKAAPVGVGSHIVQGKPSFLRFPNNGEISCMVGSSCHFPIYAVSTSTGGITSISITSSEAAGCHVSAIRDASGIHVGAKMVDMTFQDSSFGRKKICLRASDANTVIMKCFEAVVQPKDPCEVQPCHNGADCVTNGDRTSYVCICRPGYTGTFCETAPDNCNSNPCKFGATCSPIGLQVDCQCTSGYFGFFCDNTVDKCRPDPCGIHGVCEDTTTRYTCHCQNGYSGSTCTVGPAIPPVDPCVLNPTATGCNCGVQCVAPNGLCVGAPVSGTCLCSKGFSGPDCQSQISLGGQDPKFVPPTPEAEDVIKCERYIYLYSTCIFTVYTSPDTDMSTAPLVKPILPPSKVTISISSATDPKIPGILNIYRFNIKISAQSRASPNLHICLQVAKVADSTHPTDTKCFNVEYVFKSGIDPWGTPVSPAPTNKFVDPTLPDQSEIVCETGKPCHFFVFASKVANKCKHVLASDTASTAVFDPSDVGTSCMTNIVYDFTSSAVAGTRKKICLKSGDLGDVRCFYMRSVANIVDPCASSPCKNGGVCGSTQGSYVCTCTTGYSGQSCEKGPCPPTVPPHCNNGGYCYSIGATKHCFCKLGFSGQTCADNSKDTIVNPQANGAQFKDGTLPKEVTCYVGLPCRIPTTLIGDPGTSPVVSPGYVNGNLEIQGTTVTKDPSSPTDYHASVEVVSKTSGKHQICVQSNNPAGQSADEVCFMVNAVSGQFNLPSKSHAYFVDPTLPDGSSVECKTDKACHLSLWVHNYDGEDACPSVKSSQDIYTGVYIHQATGTSSSGPCKVDVVFLSNQPKTYTGICFTTTSAKHDVFGGDGETRCYDVNIVHTLSVVGSCSSTLCENGAFCDGHRTTPKCACLSGFSGPLCHQTHGESLTSPAPVTGVTQSTFGDLAVPKEIKCNLHQECEVPFTITKPSGGTGTIPPLHLGQVDSGLTVTPPTVSTDPHSPTGTYQGKVKVVGNTPGKKKVCVHTPTSSPDIVGDDICFDVDVTSPTGSSAAPSVAQPHFIEPTVQPQSTLQCEPGKICHVIMQMSPGINHGCPSVVQTQGPTDDLHLFHSDSNAVIGSCAVDVTLTPPASKQGTDTLCFDTTLPYIPGEHRCFKVDYSQIVSGPCSGVTCQHGGVCMANGQCVCPIDRSGPDCENPGNQGPAHTAVTPKFTDMALPTNVKCEINKECAIPLMVNGAQATLPHIHVGHTDSGIDVKNPEIDKTGNLPPGSNQVVLSITGRQLGNKKICVQALPAIGTGLDEQCFTVDITSPGSTPVVSTSNPHFKTPTLPHESTVSCDISKTCHVILHQTPDTTAGCPSVTADAIPGGLHVMSSTLPTNGDCRTDVSFTPSGQGDEHICLTAALPSATGEKRCYNLHVPAGPSAATPCESKNCHHGGLCTGDPSGSTAICSCAAGYSGPDCSIVGAHNIGDMTGNSIQPSAGSPPVVTDTVVPGTVSCVVNTVCHVPVLVTGDPNNPPSLTPVRNDPGTQVGQVSVPQPLHQLPGSPPGTYKGDVTVTSTTAGSHTSCVQTTDVAGNTAQTVCFKVNMIPPGSTTTSSGHQIVEPTLPAGSLIKCSKGKSCHILIHTAPEGSKCDPRVTEKGTISGGINVFAPVKDTDGTCVTDIRLPSDSLGDKHICFQVAPTTSGGNTESRCYDLHIDQDPCITLPCPPTSGTCIPGSGFPKCHCKPGYIGLTCNTHDLCASKTCNNGGVCILRDGSAFCLCPPGKQGSKCDVDASTPIPGSPSGPNTDPRFVDTVLPKRITCTVGKECKIQVPVEGSPVTSSNVQFGHLDNGVTPGSATVDPSVVSTDQHLVTFPLTPTSAGDKHVCLQTQDALQNIDEMCFIVDAKMPPAGITTNPDITKPQFSSPSIPDNSVVECKAGATCHIHLSTNPGGSGNNCPDIVQTANGQMSNVHVFKTIQIASVTDPVCQSTVTLAPTNGQIGDQHICLKPTAGSKQGNSKCFTIKVTDPSNGASTGGPCQSTHCHNGGTCDVDFTGSTPAAKCICTTGFQGPTCNAGSTCSSTTCQNGGVCVVQNNQLVCVCPPGKIGTLCTNDGSTPIPGSPSVPSGVPVFVDTALLKSITCVVNQPCAIPLPVTGSTITPSDLQFGQVDAGITKGQISIGQKLGNQNMASFMVTPTMTGNKHVCVQTKTASSNVDEVCVEVKAVSPPLLSNLPPGSTSNKPQFTSTSLPDNSVVECKVGSTCYLHLQTTPGSTVNTCPDITQTNGVNHMQNLVVFPSSSSGSSPSTCSSTVAIKPTNAQHGNHLVCLSPTQTSGTGRKKCISVHVTDSTDSTTGGPCQTFHCQNSGHCVADMTSSSPQAHCDCTGTFTGPTCGSSTNPVPAGPCNSKHCLRGGVCIVKNGQAVCLCPSGKTGDLCEQDGSTPIHGSPSVSTTDPVFVDTALPKTVKCFVGQQCTIALPVSGTGVMPSDTTFGLVDPAITPGQVTVHPLSANTNLLHIPVTPTQAGNKHVCIQTKTASSNVDEVCFNVNAVQLSGPMPPPLDVNKPQFTSPTLPDSSVVECEVDTPCHIHLATTPDPSDNSCADVEQTGLTQMKNLVAFSPASATSPSSTCNTDVTISPTNSETGDHHVCLTPTKASGEQGKSRCITVHVVGPNYASTGGPCQNLHCQNNGKCIATSTVMPLSALCTCAAGFNGPTCDTSAVDPCSSTHIICQNGGVCKNKNGKAFCLCPPGSTGENCQSGGVSGSQPDPAFIDSAIPTKVECPVGKACTIPLLLTGSGVTSSDIKFGQVDSGINPGPVSVDPTSGPDNVVKVDVTPSTVGEKRVCVQTNRPNSGTKTSKACFIVKATQNSGGVGPLPPPDHSKPQFTSSTLPDHSTIQCQAGSTCHIYLGTQPGGTGHTCPSVEQSGVTHMQNIQSFPLTTSPSPGNVCHSVMSFAPMAGPEENRVVCFTPQQASGLQGREKCLNVIVKPENCSVPFTDMHTAREATKMGRTTCKCTLTNGKEVIVINKRPKATTIQLLKAAGIGAGSVSGAVAIATIIYMIVGKIKDGNLSKPDLGGNTTHSDKTIPQAPKPRPLPRQRR